MAFDRDILGRIICEKQGGVEIKSVDNPVGERIETRSSMGAHQVITRDKMGDVTAVREESSGFEARISRDAIGLETLRELPGGIRSRWQRDALGRPIGHQITLGNRRLRDMNYEWDINDRLRKAIDGLRGPISYLHDPVGNLAAATYFDKRIDLRMPDAVGNLFRSENRERPQIRACRAVA